MLKKFVNLSLLVSSVLFVACNDSGQAVSGSETAATSSALDSETCRVVPAAEVRGSHLKGFYTIKKGGAVLKGHDGVYESIVGAGKAIAKLKEEGICRINPKTVYASSGAGPGSVLLLEKGVTLEIRDEGVFENIAEWSHGIQNGHSASEYDLSSSTDYCKLENIGESNITANSGGKIDVVFSLDSSSDGNLNAITTDRHGYPGDTINIRFWCHSASNRPEDMTLEDLNHIFGEIATVRPND
jgi:hypothetical protein